MQLDKTNINISYDIYIYICLYRLKSTIVTCVVVVMVRSTCCFVMAVMMPFTHIAWCLRWQRYPKETGDVQRVLNRSVLQFFVIVMIVGTQFF